jgi:hypothetical protein
MTKSNLVVSGGQTVLAASPPCRCLDVDGALANSPMPMMS